MAVTADVFRILLQADSGGLRKGLAEAKNELQAFDQSVRSLAGAGGIGRIGGALARIGSSLAGLVGLGAGGGLVGLAVGAAKAAAEFDVLTRSLAVTTGSMEEARRIMAFAEELAGPSAFFDTEQLARAATLMSTFNLEVTRFLPIASTMASLLGQNEESLMAFAGALGRIRAGQFGEGFEALRRFGLGREALETYGGARFTASGQFAGTPEEALAAIEKTVKARFGELDRTMQSSPMARWTSLLDALARAMRRIGAGILEAVVPAISTMEKTLSAIVASGALDRVAEATRRLFEPEAVKEWTIAVAAGVATAFQKLPAVLSALGESLRSLKALAIDVASVYLGFVAAAFASRVVGAIAAAVRAFAALRAAIAGAAGAAAILQSISGVGVAKVLAGLAAGMAAVVGIRRVLGGFGSTETDAAAGPGDVIGAYRANVEALRKALAGEGEPAGERGQGQPPLEPAVQTDPLPALVGRQTQILGAIERNTARQVELQRMILGGGELSRAILASRQFWEARAGEPAVWFPGGV
jgi:hypothetical protein